jgi:hypothetical protein
MKKKVLILALLLTLFAVFSASAYQAAIGGEFALRLANGLPSSALLSFRVPKLPPVFGVGVSIPEGGGDASFAVLADWWLAQGNLFSFINYYIGPGIYVAVAQDVSAGIRVPIGLNAYPLKPLEVFIEFAPAVGLLAPSGVQIPQWGLQAGFGFRFWF